MVYAGIAKTDDEIRMALAAGILQFNMEWTRSCAGWARLRQDGPHRARGAARQSRCRCRRYPRRSSTGRKHDKFGIAYDEAPGLYRLAASLKGVNPLGVHLHIGSQIGRLEPFAAAYRRAVDLFTSLRADGIPLQRLDLGGGFGVRYTDEPRVEAEALAGLVRQVTAGLECELLFEPGRALVAEAGVILASVIYLEEETSSRYLVLDTGNANPDPVPAMYGAHHPVLPVRRPRARRRWRWMSWVRLQSSDVLGRDRRCPCSGPVRWSPSLVPAPGR